MVTLNPDKLKALPIPISTGWLIGACMEAKGKQELWIRQKPEVIALLREQAIIQSVESSNRIEGVTIAANRLHPVVLGKSKPRDRSEEELAGYRKALAWIFSRNRPVSIRPATIRKLHAMCQGGFSGDAGEWKSKDNEIVEILPTGERRVRFVPTSAAKTPGEMDLLCRNYHAACDIEQLPVLLVISTFVFDLLCIHPFRDGNGRISRLSATLLLQSHGFEVSRFISLERLIEERKEEYYEILGRCSQSWHESENEILPWWNYFLSILRQAYREFEEKITSTEMHSAKSDSVRKLICSQVEQFTLAEISRQLPSVSSQLIKKILSELKAKGIVTLRGRGRGARWEVIG